MDLLEQFKNYRKIDQREVLERTETLPCDVFYLNEKTKSYVLLAKKGKESITLKKIPGEKYILKDDYNYYLDLIADKYKKFKKDFETKSEDKSISFVEKVEALYNYAETLVESILGDPNNKTLLNESYVLSKHTFKLAGINLSLINHLQKTRDLNKYTLGHSVNVFFAIATFLNFIARKNREFKQEEMVDMTFAALFHDIGLFNVPQEILMKPDKLTVEERKVIEHHPLEGRTILKSTLEANEFLISERTLDMILYHHERMNGVGYPKKLKGSSIPFYARTLAVCDVYIAMISDKIYQKGKPPFDAITIMKNEMNELLDPLLVQYFIILLGPKDLMDQHLKKVDALSV
ncbi:HD-GYP domain-containing protein [Spirochaetota bacterium]